jgi:hypothetical protein
MADVYRVPLGNGFIRHSISILEDNINAANKNTETLIDASKEIGREITQKTKYMLMSRHQNLEQNHNIKVAKRNFENVTKLKYSVTTVTNANLFREEIKYRLHLGNACYHSVRNHFPFLSGF